MIHWIREKLAEKRAKLLAARSKSAASAKDTPDREEIPLQNSTPAITTENGFSEVHERDDPAPTNTMCPSQHRPHNDVSQQFSFVSPHSKRISKLKNARRATNSDSSCQSAQSSEETLSANREKIRIRVICPSARILVFQADVSKRLTDLKNEVILELADDPASLPLFAVDVRQLSPRYRLFRAEYQGVELMETMTLAQLHITHDDTLVLVQRRNFLQQALGQPREMHAPRDQDVELATRHIPHQPPSKPLVDINEIFQQSNLQFDVRKVLISLAQASALVIGAGPFATRLIAMLKQKLINKRNYQNNTLQCLVDMGFTKEKSEYALKIHNGVYSVALEWLLIHQNDDNSAEENAMSIAKSQSIMSPSGILTNDTITENTQALLEIVRIYSHREIPPNTEMINELKKMGFLEDEVLIALKKTCNNKAAACEWLCGNRSGSLVELREGLSQDSPILKAILEMPQVQINLGNPKILLAFLSILENENSIRVWGGDNDTTSVITHILQRYHEEKHVLGINQFYGNR